MEGQCQGFVQQIACNDLLLRVIQKILIATELQATTSMPKHDRGIPRHQRGQVLSEIEDDLPEQYFDLMRFASIRQELYLAKANVKGVGPILWPPNNR